ncbi:MAG: bifunctional diaminohydroxyphosphoribosylaminopyrimidine deaminase/5-amino-6-(5-phosphoribosylamino)uracil reductase RibD [Candidatus Peribacteraceae bacterium]|nr:bifunctional diaminohydroxyphosphoribosylaminopyrimidine deaminase/5-amino-6-(5-phosphoribosylamino)uracil reductase RibD [Candidatus Peribacteraceae bacterium]
MTGGLFSVKIIRMNHDIFIRRCLELAEKGRGKTGTNPMVGAVLVRDEKIIAEGFHSEFGKAHAERHLLEKYVQKIRSTDTIYVNLEPCCHVNKKTPPCAQMLIERGVKNVVIGMQDPNPEVSRKGIELLRTHGVNIEMCPVMLADCLRLNRGFVSLMTKGRPWVTMQRARTPEGLFAGPDGSFLKITSHEQDRWTHEFLRGTHDAILVGIGTVLMDNPRLTIRHVPTAVQPLRIVIDSRLRLPEEANLVSDEYASRTIVVIKPGLPDNVRRIIPQLQKRGVRIMEVKHTQSGIDFPALWKALTTPDGDFHGLTSILFEGGQQMWKAFREEKCIDEEAVLVGVPAKGSEKRTPLKPTY